MTKKATIEVGIEIGDQDGAIVLIDGWGFYLSLTPTSMWVLGIALAIVLIPKIVEWVR